MNTTSHVQNIDQLDVNSAVNIMDDVDTANNLAHKIASAGPIIMADPCVPISSNSDSDDGEHINAGREISSRSILCVFGDSRRSHPLTQEDFQLPHPFIREFVKPATALLTLETLSAAFVSDGASATLTVQPRHHPSETIAKIPEPSSCAEAMNSSYHREWNNAIEEELPAIGKMAYGKSSIFPEAHRQYPENGYSK